MKMYPHTAHTKKMVRSRESDADEASLLSLDWKYQLKLIVAYPSSTRALRATVSHAHRSSYSMPIIVPPCQRQSDRRRTHARAVSIQRQGQLVLFPPGGPPHHVDVVQRDALNAAVRHADVDGPPMPRNQHFPMLRDSRLDVLARQCRRRIHRRRRGPVVRLQVGVRAIHEQGNLAQVLQRRQLRGRLAEPLTVARRHQAVVSVASFAIHRRADLQAAARRAELSR